MRTKKWAITLLTGLLFLTACSSNNAATSPDPGSKMSGGKKNVVIAVQSSDRFLETAAQKFEDQHPEIHIEIKEYLATASNGNGMKQATSQADMEKFVQTVTTQVASGKGADLIAMNSLPQDKFVEKKLLVNLYDLMAKDSSFDKSKYYPNILKASQNGDGLYAMPFAFALDVMEGNTDLLKKANVEIDDKTWTWDQFKDIAKKLKQQAGSDYVGIVNLFPNQLLADYIDSNYSKLVQQGKANFDSDLFRNMMRQIKAMYDEGILKAEFSYDYSKSLFSMYGLASPEQAITQPANTSNFQKPTVDGKAQGGGFKTYFSLGLNSKSKVQPEAWEFIKFLLSDEMQSSSDLMGLPLNKAVIEKKLDAAIQSIANGKLQMPKMKPDDKMVDERIQALKKLLEGAGVKSSSDMKVVSIAMEEFESYMSGQKSAEEVSKLIQNRVNTYLNE
ncbi:ABC transporter substrate-binding protein [Paenibacillus aceris]|uniref:Multiple sugar transport system substrate-binding protein n=1 Tax=Paenibacillus aceris TaxID=869555 RepID=A0ABS4I909_9BACL|nr:extracellular solute-binding protein [Paenibacillus aceris]MBP1967160.1 multiple sugar transport system substrate-binding protein [Paenibacillus aceris]NHW35558.1 extracellular solute-binding protein [Paenibacillus aceris]